MMRSTIFGIAGRSAAAFLLLCTVLAASAAARSPDHSASEPPPTPSAESPTYVTRTECTGCHPKEARLWSGSHHDRAMERADDKSVLGNFDGAEFTYFGITSRFFKKDGKFFVHTDGADGAMADFEIAYTFGVDPLQQYLVRFPGGRLQCLTIAWDSHPKAQGGQRWFHLYPDEKISHGDPLHWTGGRTELELHLRHLPLDQFEEELRGAVGPLRHEVVGDRRVVRGLSRARLAPRGMGEGAREGEDGRRRRRTARPPGGDDGGAMGDGSQDRQRQPRHAAANEPDRSLRSVSLAPQRHLGRLHSRPAAARLLPAGAPDSRALPRRRSDRGRGVRVRVVSAEQDAAQRRRLQRLPQPPQPGPARFGQRPVHPLPRGDQVRRQEPLLPSARLARVDLRRVPHADDDVHGRRPAPRSQPAHPAAGPERDAGHAQRLQQVSRRQERRMGRGQGSRMVRAHPRRLSDLRRGAATPVATIRRGPRICWRGSSGTVRSRASPAPPPSRFCRAI